MSGGSEANKPNLGAVKVNQVSPQPNPQNPHNPTPASLGAVNQQNATGGPRLSSTLGAVPSSAAPGVLIKPGSKSDYPGTVSPPVQIPNHTSTLSTLGAVPRVASPVGMNPIHNPTPPTLGAVSQQTQPYPRPLAFWPALGPSTSNVAPTSARYVGQAPALAQPERKSRPPLVNYAPGTMKLSILIPTLTNRAMMLGQLLQKLEYQIRTLGPHNEVEVLVFEDNKENPVGFKRNRLLSEAKGDFVVFVDDDDELSDDYVFQIYTAILDHPKVDCIGMRAMITVNGKNPKQVIYSLHNRGLYESEGIYYRPPGHLTPLRRSIAQRYRFPDKNFGEDSEWAMAMVADKAFKTEFFIDKVLYHYKFSHVTSETAGTRVPGQLPVPPTFSVVILSAKPDNLRDCLAWLFEKEPMFPRNRIIVVDDGAQAGWEGAGPGVSWVQGIKPFVFARNANIGIRAAGTDVLLLNDDARLTTKFGFTSMSFAARSRPDVGICSAAISGVVGNPSQQPWLVAAGMRYEPANLAFVAVYIPKSTFDRVGPLDEQFAGYGYEDNDYCVRVKKAGLGLSIYDGCVVEHSVAGNSTFRTKLNIQELMEANRQLFIKKWGGI
jgi:GT2 family glycosyltransferase